MNLVSLTREMAAAKRYMEELPETQEWTQDELSTLDDVRHAALRLAEEVEAIFDTINGGKHP